jgi:hypothetical protein
LKKQVKQAAELFKKHTDTVIRDYRLDYVINTDQTGCEYSVNIRRALSHKGEKTTEVLVHDINKIIHFYTVQYVITASLKLLPVVFISLQEKSGTFFLGSVKM